MPWKRFLKIKENYIESVILHVFEKMKINNPQLKIEISMKTKQEEFWSGEFGKEYSDRNTWSIEEYDKFYLAEWGKSRTQMNEEFIGSFSKKIKILEVGCNVGMQLQLLQRMGYTNLYGIELQEYAVEKAKTLSKGINIIQGSGFDIPFRDNFFDIVVTNGVLIHISPEDHNKIMQEMFRCSNRYVWGFEYYSPELQTLPYRGNEGYLWKTDFAKVFSTFFPNLKEIKRAYHKYTYDENIDMMYLLEKQ
jgi:pseudaminic acid biosynthesis-associated methylase